MTTPILRTLGVAAATALLLSGCGGGSPSSDTGSSSVVSVDSTPAAETPAAPAAPDLTSQQQNAAEAAQNYLDLGGFSRLGLIRQLSSSAGDGYSKADATKAVDSLKVDWNAQAVRSAKEYLATGPFSCQGMIRQLSSSSGSEYTKAQATYGAKKAGAC